MSSSRHNKRSRRRRNRTGHVESLEVRRLLASDWQNRDSTFDVNRDARVTAIDALVVINEINRRTIIDDRGALPDREAHTDRPFWDTTGDQRVTALDALRIINEIGRDNAPPFVQPTLLNDTSVQPAGASDGRTADPTVSGIVFDSLGILSLTASINGGTTENVDVEFDGSFQFTPALALDGTDDGIHELVLAAQDSNRTEAVSQPFQFTLDTLPPDAWSIDLAPESDTGAASDQTTSLTTVRLIGQTEPRAHVEMTATTLSTTADATGRFFFDSVALAEGMNTIPFRVYDVAGNSADFSAVITRVDNTAPEIQLALADDSGLRSSDMITNRADVSGMVSDTSEVSRVEVMIDNALGYADVTDTLSATGSFLIDQARLESIFGGPLGDGEHTVRVRAEDAFGNLSGPSLTTFYLDTSPPNFIDLSVTNNATLSYESVLRGTLDATGPGTGLLNFHFDDDMATPVSVDLDGTFERAPFAKGISEGAHELTVTGTDAAGNESSVVVQVMVDNGTTPMRVSHFTPLASADEVGVTFRPQVFFSRPVDAATLTDSSFFASFSGQDLPATIVPAEDGQFAWLFFDEPLPDSATIEVRAIGDDILSLDGQRLDGDGDGTPGGDLIYTFSTVGLQPLPGTVLTGVVLDPGPDLTPHTSDDAPISGVEVFLLGLEDNVRVTDALGRYTFDAVPGGNVKVAIDGRTASAPEGVYFPEMVMDAHMVPSATNFVMGMEETFLPRLKTSILQDISASENSVVRAEQDAAPGLTEEQRSNLMIEVPAGSLIAADGSRLNAGKVGISTVPAELVRDMLPPGILQHTFDITVQAPGISNFSTPAPLTIPNMVGALPGEQINLLSFDHTTGRLVIEGTMTVSADGLSATTDPGTGITHPGWHGGTRTGSQIIVGEPIEEGDNEPGITAIGTSTFFTAGGQQTNIVISNNGSPGMDQTASITVDLIGIEDFAPGLGRSQRFDLPPGESVTLVLQSDDMTFEDVERFNSQGIDGEVYSGRVQITAGGLDVNGQDFEEFFYGRFFSAYSETEQAGIPFEPTITGSIRNKSIDLIGDPEVDFSYDVHVGADHFQISETAESLSVSFSPDLPESQQELPLSINGNLNVLDPDGNVFGQIPLPADYRPTTQVFINEDDIASVLDRLAGRLQVEGISIVDDPAEQGEVVQGVADRIRQLLRPFGSSIEFVDTVGPNTISVNWGASL
ncbi:MAG: Ig-like domain-containing protein, partial [Planctomycetota bacterium]